MDRENKITLSYIAIPATLEVEAGLNGWRRKRASTSLILGAETDN